MTDSNDNSNPPPTPPLERLPMARREFLGIATACLGAVGGVTVLGIVGTTVVGTPLSQGSRGKSDAWLDLGPLERFPQGKAAKVAVVGELRDGWSRFQGRSLGNVVVLRQEEGVRVLSATCPHNGCDVFVSSSGLICPCHDSRFSLEGEVETGPSPRALDPLQARLEEGRVWVKFERFQVGVAERRPL